MKCLIFLSDYFKQDADTTSAHRNCSIELMKNNIKLMSALSTIYEKNDGYAEQYRYATAI